MPYELGPEFLAELFSKHAIDYVVHGDDPCLLPDGSDAYAYAKQQARALAGQGRVGLGLGVGDMGAAGGARDVGGAALAPVWRLRLVRLQGACAATRRRAPAQGRFRMIKRTEGVSSTNIVGRMLMCTRDNARFREARPRVAAASAPARLHPVAAAPGRRGPHCTQPASSREAGLWPAPALGSRARCKAGGRARAADTGEAWVAYAQDKRELTRQFSRGREGSATGEPAEGGRSQNGDGAGRKARRAPLSAHTHAQRFGASVGRHGCV